MHRQEPEIDGSTDVLTSDLSASTYSSQKFRHSTMTPASSHILVSSSMSVVQTPCEGESSPTSGKTRRRLTSLTDVQPHCSFDEDDNLSPSSSSASPSLVKQDGDFDRGYQTDPCTRTIRRSLDDGDDDHASRVVVIEDKPVEESSEHSDDSFEVYTLEQLLLKGTSLEQCEGVSAALVLYERAIKEKLVEEVLDIAYLQYKIGVLQWKRASYEQSLILLRRSMKVFENEGGTRVKVLAEIYFALGRTLASLSERKRARKYFMRALRTLEYDEFVDNKVKSENQELRAKILTQVASLLICYGSYDMASTILSEAITIQRQILGPKHSDVASTLLVYGSLNEALNQHEYAANCYLEALEIFRLESSTSSFSCVDMSVTLSNVGWLFYLSQDYSNAMQSYEEALELTIPILGESHRNVASLRVQIGMVHAQQGKLKRALKLYRQALQVQRAVLGDEHEDVALTLSLVGSVYNEMGKFGKAVEFTEHALATRKKFIGPNSVLVGSSFVQLGRTYLNMEEHSHASRCFTSALAAYHENGLPGCDPRVVEAGQLLSQTRSFSS